MDGWMGVRWWVDLRCWVSGVCAHDSRLGRVLDGVLCLAALARLTPRRVRTPVRFVVYPCIATVIQG